LTVDCSQQSTGLGKSMKISWTIVAGAAVAAAFSSAASAQFRTVGPATPVLVTGRSVSVPAYHQADPQAVMDEESDKNAVLPDDGHYIAGATGERASPR
jgi:hypothetical protein